FGDKNVGSGKTVTATGIALGGAAAANYVLGSTTATTTAAIAAKVLTATATGGNKSYDGTTNESVSILLSGIVGSEDVSATGSGAFADKNVGTGKTVNVTGIAEDDAGDVHRLAGADVLVSECAASGRAHILTTDNSREQD